jgi:hypothetical protein
MPFSRGFALAEFDLKHLLVMFASSCGFQRSIVFSSVHKQWFMDMLSS